MNETASFDIDPVPASVVPDVWPGVGDLVAKAAAEWPRDRSLEDYFTACRSGAAQLWFISSGGKLLAVCITELMRFPQHLVGVIELLAGEGIEEWAADLDRVLVEWARSQGCDRLRTGGRKGLKKVATTLGYSEVAILLEKDLSDAGR